MQERVSIRYQDCRESLADGDVLLFKGKGIISWLIQRRTGSPYSHAGIIAWWNDRLMVLEATSGGITAMTLSQRIQSEQGRIDYFQPKDTISPSTRRQMVVFAQQQLGKQYAFKKLLKYAFKKLLKYAVMHLAGVNFSQQESQDCLPV